MNNNNKEEKIYMYPNKNILCAIQISFIFYSLNLSWKNNELESIIFCWLIHQINLFYICICDVLLR